MSDRIAIPCSSSDCRRFLFFEGEVPKHTGRYVCAVCHSENETWALIREYGNYGYAHDLEQIRDAINVHFELRDSYQEGKDDE